MKGVLCKGESTQYEQCLEHRRNGIWENHQIIKLAVWSKIKGCLIKITHFMLLNYTQEGLYM